MKPIIINPDSVLLIEVDGVVDGGRAKLEVMLERKLGCKVAVFDDNLKVAGIITPGVVERETYESNQTILQNQEVEEETTKYITEGFV